MIFLCVSSFQGIFWDNGVNFQAVKSVQIIPSYHRSCESKYFLRYFGEAQVTDLVDGKLYSLINPLKILVWS